LRTWLIFLLSGGLFYTQISPTLGIQRSAQQLDPTNTRSELLLSFLGDEAHATETPSIEPNLIFIDDINTLPQAVNDLENSANASLKFTYAIADPNTQQTLNTIGSNPQAIIVPPTSGTASTPTSLRYTPAGSPLDLAYTQGGRPFYQEADQVVIIFPDQKTFRSFYVTTGLAGDYLQLELSLPAIDAPGAYQTYTEHYGGKVVAETSEWALVKFPSGSFLKVAKPKNSFITQK
jgi:hypothetical protein